jgi:phosphohistidine phosphatase
MNIYILRHGIAVERGTPGCTTDADRPLTAEGERKLRLVAGAIKAMEIDFDVVLSSPYLRARQTAEVVAAALALRRRLDFSDSLVPNGSTRRLVALLGGLAPPPENILLVGHEPYLSGLISLLVSGGESFAVVLKKGGLSKLSVESLGHGRCAALEWILTPRQMALMT